MEQPVEDVRRWLVKTNGKVHEVTGPTSRAVVLSMWPGSQACLMGTHESEREAAKRMGWSL